MSSAEVLSPPSSHAAVEAGSLQQELLGPLGAIFSTSLQRESKKASWRQDASKANASITSLLDQKTEAHDVVALDNYVQPIDRGPSAAEAQRLMRTWQYQVTGKVAAAAALAELKAGHIKHGGAAAIHVEACKQIEQNDLEDTFYIVDLGNVLRMYKVMIFDQGTGRDWEGTYALHAPTPTPTPTTPKPMKPNAMPSLFLRQLDTSKNTHEIHPTHHT